MNAVYVRDGAMDRDAIATTHPIVQRVETVEQVGQAFDAISYSKGERSSACSKATSATMPGAKACAAT